MAIIYSYPQGTPTLLDNVIGSQIDPTTEENKTVQFTIGSIATLIGSGSGGGSGTVTSVATTHGGNAFTATIGNVATVNPSVDIAMAGNATQYVNGAGDLVLLSTLPQGTTTANNAQSFTNKSGNISQWINDSGYVTSSGGSGTVTTVSATIAGDAFDVAVTDPTTAPALGFTWAGSSAQYITGQGNVATFPTIPTVNNGELAINTGTGLSGTGTFTANQSNNSTVLFGLDLTEITLGVGLDSTTTGLSLDLSEFTDMTATMLDTDEFIVLDNGAQGRKAAGEIGLSIFNNDAGFITSSSIPSVGDGTLTVQGTTGLAGSGTFTANQAGNTTITLTNSAPNIVQTTITGNAGTATALETAVTIAGVSFDGTSNISLDNANIANGAGYVTSSGVGMTGFGVSNTGTGGSTFAMSNGLTMSIVGGTNIASGFSSSNRSITLSYNGPLPAITTNGSAPSLASGISEQSVRGLIKAQFDVGLLQDTVTVTAAQLNSLSTTPVVLIASPGVNKYIKVIEASFYYLVGTTIHTFADDVEAQINSINQFIFQNALTPTFGRTTQVRSLNVIHDGALAADTRLVLTTDSASSTTGDGTVKVKIMYQILDTSSF